MRCYGKRRCLLLVFFVLACTVAAEQRLFLLHSMRLRGEERRCRLLLENNFVEAALVREVDRGEAELYPGLRSRHMAAGSLSPEGLAAVAGSGRFAGYAAGYELGEPGMRVDLGLDPVQRRGIALMPLGNAESQGLLLYWMREEDTGEAGAFYTLEAADFLALDFGLMRNRIYRDMEPDLSADRIHIGRSEEVLKGASALHVRIPWIGSLTLVGASSILPSLPAGGFFGASLGAEHRIFACSVAADYSSRFYVYRDGDVAEGRWNGSFELGLLPQGPTGCEVGGVLRDGGVELSPGLYRETEHELYGGLRLGSEALQFRAERRIEWWWETDGEGGYEDVSLCVLDLETDMVSAEMFHSFGEEGESCDGTEEISAYGGELELELYHVRASAECERKSREAGRAGGVDPGVEEELSYAFGLEAELGPRVEIGGRFGREEGESFWSLFWDVGGELVLPGGGAGCRDVP
jgi:hypothetical protein